MGYLTEKLSIQVHHIAQERGRSYFFNGSVKQVEGNEWRVTAKVQGSALYNVIIASEDDFLDVQCSCPYFDKELETCKHIWAALLAAERQGLLKGAASKRSLQIFESFNADGDDNDDAGDVRRPQRDGKISPLSRHPEVPEWQRVLQLLRTSMGAAENRSGTASAPERQLFYLINADDSLDTGHLVIEVTRRERK